MILFVLAGIFAMILLTLIAIKKLSNKTYKIFICAANLAVLILLAVLACAVKIVKRNLDEFLDSQISIVEEKADEIYPGVMNMQMDTAKVKRFLDKALTFESAGTLESIAVNIVKSNLKDFSLFSLETIKKLERTENKLSIKEALVSLKDMCTEKADGYYKIAYAMLSIFFAIYFVFMIFLCNYLAQAQGSMNKSIVFGDDLL